MSVKEEREARRWKKELTLATKREKPWRDAAEKIVARYRGDEKKRNRFNVLWATTEVLRPAIYNSKPNPDVRRRFRDSDPLGKAVGETIERALFVLFDGDGPDRAIKNDLLDALTGGRGVTRAQYVPKLSESDSSPEAEVDEGQSQPAEAGEDSDSDQEVEDEAVEFVHIDYRDYREGYGRVWDEVPWVAFRHKLVRADAEEKFEKSDIKEVEFSVPQTDDPHKNEDASETQKVAEFWEFWDKAGKKVFFTQDKVDRLLYPKDNPDGEPPIKFEGFFPIPNPLTLVENTGSRLPIAPFHLYEEQANELDKISGRIDKIVNVCRLRGVYDSALTEMPDLLAGDDNELTPIQNAQAWTNGGLDKAISWFPVDQLQSVLKTLNEARKSQLDIIYELTGIADIVRGATMAQETATAQQLKSNYASIRLKRQQQELQRYVRDLMRLASEIMCQKFATQTFKEMTDLKFPMAAEKALMQQQAHMQPPGSPPNPNLQAALQVPTWEDIEGMMKSPALRQFRVDVETDSTVAGTLDNDMRGLSEVLKAITETMQGLTPLVQAQALPVDAAKEIVLSVIRRARMGTAVEDAFDKLQAPKPPPHPQDTKPQVAQIKAQSDQQLQQMQQQHEQATQQATQQHEQAMEQARQSAENQRMQFEEQAKSHREQTAEHLKTLREDQAHKLDAAVKIIIAKIAAKSDQEIAANQLAVAEAQRDLAGSEATSE